MTKGSKKKGIIDPKAILKQVPGDMEGKCNQLKEAGIKPASF